eukprot:CAMPEP_0183346316 /NCGR_PEP_ID=MMETSP0164_2-20130417/11476_1 /TAXON_ID=221442 /ORGANISM="Coccolithus pelagicus ssp braarudi, Strain PLY182g" /LENGTH=30 /DNA_ID= /DNA_START= /DNA_END= /DNA_ORIENTATION=
MTVTSRFLARFALPIAPDKEEKDADFDKKA